MSAITTHVLDAVLGKPAAGLAILLERRNDSGWMPISSGATDKDGRCRDLSPDSLTGTYRLTFSVAEYFARQGRSSIYPEIAICFVIDGVQHYHIPVLLSDNSYTTYRGS